jgi:hypothetical protein
MRRHGLAVSLCLLLAGAVSGQNSIFHFDGTIEFTSRGANGINAKYLAQRLPGDQLCGATAITSVSIILQDQNVTTTEMATIEIRTNDPAGPATGAPDMSAAGLLASVPLGTIQFPGAGPVGVLALTSTFTPPIAIPPTPTAMPGSDLYIGVAFPPAPGWTMDGISVNMSGGPNVPGEMQTSATPGYTGIAGSSGLGWDVDLTTGTAMLGTGNRSWRIQTFVAEDVCQPFADNPAAFMGAGAPLNPNFGYSGIFPDMNRMVAGAVASDGFGYRVLATAAVGSSANLFVTGPPLMPVATSVSPVGVICIDPLATIPAPFTPLLTQLTVAGPAGSPAGQSMATFGPFPGNPSIAGLVIHAQCLTIDITGLLRLSTVGTLHF